MIVLLYPTSDAGTRFFHAAIFRRPDFLLENGLPIFELRRTWGIIDGLLHGPWWEMTFLPKRKDKQDD